MEWNDLEEVIKELNTISKQEKIEIFRIGSSLPSEIPTIQLDEDENKGIAETDTDAISEIRNFMRLAKSLEIKAVFYKLDQIDHKGKKGYYLELYLIHNSINFTSKIMSLNYLELLKERDNDQAIEMGEKLNKVRDALKDLILNENFDAFQMVKDRFLPFLGQDIDYSNEYSRVDFTIRFWFNAISNVANMSTLVDELVDYYVDKEVDYEFEVYGLKFLGQLINLAPYMYNNVQEMIDDRRGIMKGRPSDRDLIRNGITDIAHAIVHYKVGYRG